MSSGDAGSPEPPVLSKKALRAQLRRRRDAVSPDQRRACSTAASAAVVGSGLLASAETLAVYAAIGSEADPSALVEWHQRRGGVLAYPRVTSGGLVWHRATPDTLTPSPPWSIPEPVAGRHRALAINDIDAWIVPGLGFTQDGLRLGYGKGYYDRALAGVTVPTVGFGFALQLVPELPVERHDQRVTAVATERGLVRTGVDAHRPPS